ncbi:succinylglutamate desuccinylase/aspartoacylase family protein [Rhodohalobacter sp.]|uniref:succinylglutamate desuccinylase/aspartoacylase family protein n=1 Tax=Rhodohalobacter sp. TaxID=1974210 RepID=UPI002ACEC21F|nr:succinylglutamate desuccinylase/aspartoacylase family protein [Rhodohalobacter sp.]MDZ7756513.1 succinylglutamate desuccinylase/aspartoacylase family protein [Rhodohalobacter sp.]
MRNSELQEVIIQDTDRIRWKVPGDVNGPVVVVFAGIHGNETAGVHATDTVVSELLESGENLNGSLYVITGNMRALELGVRFVDTDLNRLWETGFDRSHYSPTGNANHSVEYKESLEIKNSVEWILNKHRDTASDFVFIDLHTTSSESCAFILINDRLDNRRLARKFPVPQILGFEENIRGTLLSYINNIGHMSIGFEAGAHTSVDSVTRSQAFLRLAMHWLGMVTLKPEEVKEYEEEMNVHPNVPDSYFEVSYHKIVEDAEKFDMREGYHNFDRVEKGEFLAYENGERIEAPVSGRIFMPLYQKIGNDGFLIINEVAPLWLKLSALMRTSFFHNILHWLPGVSKDTPNAYLIDIRVARFLVKNIFHLLGYRVIKKDEHTLICYKR